MQRNMRLALGVAAVAIVGGHYAFWWMGTQQMQKALQDYAASVQLKSQTFTYEATPAGYPFRRELLLRNVALVSRDKTGHVTSELRIPGRVTMNAGDGVTDKMITISGNRLPFEFMLEQADPVGDKTKVLKLSGTVDAMENRASMEWGLGRRNMMTSQMAGIRFQLPDRNLSVDIGNISQTLITTPDDGRSIDYRMVTGDLKAKGQDTHNGQTSQKDLSIENIAFGFRMSKLASSMPVLHQFVLNLNKMKSVNNTTNPKTGHPLTETMDIGNMDFKGGSIEHDNFQDFTIGLKVGPLNGSAEASLLADVKEIRCSLSYSNLPNDIMSQFENDKTIMAKDEARSVFVSRIMAAMVKQKMSFAVDDCEVNSKALNGKMKGMLSATDDGYPNVMLRATATGEAAAGLNAMKDMMLPGDGSALADKLDISVLTVSNTLMVDGKPVMPLPPLTAVAGMMGAQTATNGIGNPAVFSGMAEVVTPTIVK